MKIVLNKCYGGFSLSEEQAIACGIDESELYDRGDSKVFYGGIERTNKDLIKAVEQGLPNAWASELVVVEIPDDAYYKIEEYDGLEYIVWSESEINYA